jgi:hypothetical protein
MNDDNMIGQILLGILASIGTTFLLGHRFGFDDGVVDGKNQGIVLCMEQPQKCKISYEYLKLQENTNE